MRWSMLVAGAVLLISVSSLGGQTKEIQDKLKANLTEMKNLQGTWIMESATMNGTPLNNKTTRVVFDKDVMTMFIQSKGKGGKELGQPTKYELDLNPNRKLLTYRVELIKKGGEKKAIVFHAIYELKGEILNFYLSGTSQPPVASVKEAADQWLLLRFKRAK